MYLKFGVELLRLMVCSLTIRIEYVRSLTVVARDEDAPTFGAATVRERMLCEYAGERLRAVAESR
jgi:hypothetical protein